MTNQEIVNAYVGLDQVDALYLGQELIWSNTPPGPIPYSEQYLTIKALGSGDLYVRNEGVEESVNGGAWAFHSSYSTPLALSQGDEVRFRANNNTAPRGLFSGSTLSFQVYGNIESLEYGDNFSGQTAVRLASGFTELFFSCTGLTDASNLILPATSLTEYCYNSLFSNCYSLTAIPSLPAPVPANNSYRWMYGNCSGLTSVDINYFAPQAGQTLPAKPMSSMFRNTRITTAPILPATTIGTDAYGAMFRDNPALVTGPVVCATTLPGGITYMFENCSALTSCTFYALSGTPIEIDTYHIHTNGKLYVPLNTQVAWSGNYPYTWTLEHIEKPLLYDGNEYYSGTTEGTNYAWYFDPDADPGGIIVINAQIYVGGEPVTGITYQVCGCGTDCGGAAVYGCEGDVEDPETYEITSNECATGTSQDGIFESNTGMRTVIYDPINNSVSADTSFSICPCGDWEGEGYSSYEECMCNNGAPEYCGGGEDPCEDWEGNGYQSLEDCLCQQFYGGEDCPDCAENWESLGFESEADCLCGIYGECPNPCEDWENLGYESYEDCDCQENGNCEEEEPEP